MNNHLDFIFEKILPTLEKQSLNYWVYGGVAIAGVNNCFFRENKDVDIFTYQEDYPIIADILIKLGTDLTHRVNPKLRDIRPKVDFFIEGSKVDILSVIPIYKLNGKKVKFIYQSDFVPKCDLIKETRAIGSYKFITPSTEFIKEQFIRKIGGKLVKHKELNDNEKKDAEVLFGKKYSDVIKEYFLT